MQMINKQNISIGILVLFHAIGVLGSMLFDAQTFMQLSPLNLLLTLGILIFNHVDRNHLWIWPATMVLGFAVEVLGVNTGFPFGEYSYGEALGWKLFNTPLIIGVNWFILLYGANAVANKYAMTPWTKALIAAGLMLILDYLIEPVAMRYDFWSWATGSPPLENYLAWFGISFLLSLMWQFSKIKLNTGIASAVYATELFFFGILNLFP